MASCENAGPTHQCIVLPLQPAPRQSYDGVGLALHFLLGNVVVLHSGLKELWFGWRIKKIFEDAASLADHCRGTRLNIGLKELSQQQKVRFWIYGHYGHPTSEIGIYDADKIAPEPLTPLPVSCDDHLVHFRQSFMERFDRTGVVFSRSQKHAALWKEHISIPGLDAVGRALEAFYHFSAFDSKIELDLEPFETAVRQAPKAFMSHDLLGWALYRLGRHAEAVDAFHRALSINPNGAGAMAGLIWCHIHMNDLEKTRSWAERKADACGQDATLARERAVRLFEKHAEGKGQKKD